MAEQKRVVIVGGGFAGLNAAKKFMGDESVKVTLIDRRNHHLFQPLLYQVATAGLGARDIAVPIRRVLKGAKNVEVILGEVKAVDLAQQEVVTEFKNYKYDYLILACGAVHSYFGQNQWEEHAPGLKTLEQAHEIRRRVLTAFESAERETDNEKRRAFQTFIVIGGGPTGVELAGALGEISRYALSKDFVNIDPRQTRILLIEAGQRILPSFDAKLSQKAVLDLERLGVSVWTNTRVTDVTAEGVYLGKEFVRAGAVIWAAGVKASELNPQLGVPVDRVGRVIVNEDLSIPGNPNIFVLGDQAHFSLGLKGPIPGLAPAAIQMGIHCAKNILREIKGLPRESFKYFDKGQMATIGRTRAVLEFGPVKMHGFWAWLAWVWVHVYYLIDFSNKLIVLIQWGWAFFTNKKGARIITVSEWRLSGRKSEAKE